MAATQDSKDHSDRPLEVFVSRVADDSDLDREGVTAVEDG